MVNVSNGDGVFSGVETLAREADEMSSEKMSGGSFSRTVLNESIFTKCPPIPDSCQVDARSKRD
jgi:hypothetical protein